jgi:CDP-diacylglycerol--glycerol-3-phosphate 3-phosphatidyltransferase
MRHICGSLGQRMSGKILLRSNCANLISIFRVLLVPFLIVSIFSQSPLSGIAAIIIFAVAALTDYLDGVLARKFKILSSFGDFFDPLADKLLVGSVFVSFAFFPGLLVPVWLVFIILLREVFVTLFRMVAIRKGSPLKTEFSGKIKTVMQMFSIFSILVLFFVQKKLISQNPALGRLQNTYFWTSVLGTSAGKLIHYLPLSLVSLSAVLAFISMVQYILKNKQVFSKSSNGCTY